jgi:hypothetical protein
MCVPVFGAEQDSKGLEEAVVATKKILTIPDSYSEFTHYSNESEKSGSKVTVWELSWAEKEGNNGFISASIDTTGNLYEYNKYSRDESNTGLAKVTKKEAQNSAEKFLRKVIISDIGEMKIIDENQNGFQSDTYDFTYEKFINDIPANFYIINISVNKYTGEVTSFNKLNTEVDEFEYPNLEGLIESSVAEKNYIDKVDIKLGYYSYYDYTQKKINVFAGYTINDNRYKAIDGKTGEAIYLSNQNKNFYNSYADGKNDNVMVAENSKELTKEETDAINNITGLITKEKAENIIKESLDIISSQIKVSNTSLNKDNFSQKYVWQIAFEGGYGQVDAQSGELISVHVYNESDNENKNVSKLEAQNIAESFLKKITPNKFSQTEYEKNEYPDLNFGIVVDGDSSYFNFVRQVNGIEFDSNSLSVEVDKTNGKVIGYDNNWYDNVEFPDTSEVMNNQTAFNKIKEYNNFTLQYAMVDENKVQLVYNFEDLNDKYIIDPVSGIRLDYTGQVYKENKLPEYTDISGHWCEKTIKELLENGYYIDGEKFNPDMNISQINFLKYIYSPMKNNYTDDEFYDMLMQNGVIKKEEKHPNSFVSNQDAAKFIVRYLEYDKVGSHPEIFINPFKDKVEEQYKGYAAICYGFGIVKGDKNGNFNGTDNITNAQAAVIVYNLIKNNTH